ncbi:hypothetical protein RhiirB3_446291 [Rhizophagus irregularis]|nr:hypothetical protein RhiirB3_446291 [Rhizophagus irregularis]
MLIQMYKEKVPFSYVNIAEQYEHEAEVARSGPHSNLLSVRNTLLNAFKEKISSKVIVGLWRSALKNAKGYFESEEFDAYSSSDDDHVDGNASADPPRIIPRQLDPFKPCDITKTYPLTITTLSYSPNPIVAGGNLMLKIAGTTQVEVQQKSTLKIQMTYLPSKTLDFCDLVASYIPCPISVAEEFLLPTMMDSKFTNLVEQFISVETSYYTQLLSKFIMQLIHLKHHGGKPNLKTVNEAREELDKTMKNYGG